jgi:hypothetical protein
MEPSLEELISDRMTEMYRLVLHVDILASEVNLLTRVDLKRTIWDSLGHIGVSYEIYLLEVYYEHLN